MDDLERTHDGSINNCALANGDRESNCQICEGRCPDRTRFGLFEKSVIIKPMKTRSEAAAERKALSPRGDRNIPNDGPTHQRMREASTSEVKIPKPSPFKFESANAAKKDKVRPDLQKIVETIFVNDVHETWSRLKDALMIGEKRSDHGTLQKALDKAERNAYDAHRLFVTAKVERDRWERENDTIFGAMWSEATADLQKEKEDGTRSKQITDADVKMRCATLHPDEFHAQEAERARVKATIDSLENLSLQWMSRCNTLRNMMGKLRG